jgi:hypothetical protein
VSEVCWAPVGEDLRLAPTTRRHRFQARCPAAGQATNDVLVAAGSDDGSVLIARDRGGDCIALELQDPIEDLCVLPSGMVVAATQAGLLWLAPFGSRPIGQN